MARLSLLLSFLTVFVSPGASQLTSTTLAVSFKNCGSGEHVVVHDVTPHSLTTGVTTTLTGSGHLDIDVTGATYTIKMTGLGGATLADCEGDAAADNSCPVKLGPIPLGTLAYKGIQFPLKAGDISGIPKVDITTPSSLPPQALDTTTTLTVTAKTGEAVMCVEIMTKPAHVPSPIPSPVLPLVSLMPALQNPGLMSSTLTVTFKNCGSGEHVVVKDVTPHSITLGSKTTLTGAGHLDIDVTGATFTIKMTGLGGATLADCKGDAATDQSCPVKLGPISLGSLDYHGMTFPLKAGDLSGIPKVDITTPSTLPGVASKTTTTLTATAKTGEALICVEIMTAPAATETVLV